MLYKIHISNRNFAIQQASMLQAYIYQAARQQATMCQAYMDQATSLQASMDQVSQELRELKKKISKFNFLFLSS